MNVFECWEEHKSSLNFTVSAWEGDVYKEWYSCPKCSHEIALTLTIAPELEEGKDGEIREEKL